MRLSRFLAGCLLAGALGAMQAPFVLAAATSCECFCTSTKGAVSKGNMASALDCDVKCTATKGSKQIFCAKSPAEAPANLPRCFADADMCATNCAGPSVPNQPPNGSIYDTKSQPAECPAGYHYCYCTGQPYKLAVKIGSVDTVNDIGDYVQKAYRYLLGIAVTVSIVFIMIGGLQYVLAAGTGNTKAGKDKIKNAVVGLVLLVSAALILQSVNPRLLSLQPPRLPSVKRINIVKAGQDCFSLANAGATIDGFKKGDTEKACGTKAKVLKDTTGTAVADGVTCIFRGCGDPETGCFVTPQGGKCLKCAEVVPTEDVLGGVPPTTAVCSALAKKSAATEFNYCFWSRNPYLLFGANPTSALQVLGIGGGFVLGSFIPVPGASVLGAALGGHAAGADKLYNGTCSAMKIDCAAIVQKNCEAYNTQIASNKIGGNTNLKTISPGWGDLSIQEICVKDPCGFSATEGACVFTPISNTCVSPIRGRGAVADTCTDTTQCISGMRCSLGQCIPGVGLPDGETCAAAGMGGRFATAGDGDCQSGICNTKAAKCVSVKSMRDGEACDRPSVCQSENCVSDVCRPNKTSVLGTICGSDSECISGACHSVLNKCIATNSGLAGSGCTRPVECASNSCTDHGILNGDIVNKSCD